MTRKKLIKTPDKLGDYNVPRYIAAFNKRIEPLLVVFNPEIRESIIIEDPKDRPIFTKSQAELVRGFPRRNGDQDTLEEVMTLSDGEIAFWRHVGIDPYYMYLEGTKELVEEFWVNKNTEIMYGDYKVNTVIPKDELYETNENGDYLIYAF